jgi:hypothetical protein
MPVQPHKKHYLYRKRQTQIPFETASNNNTSNIFRLDA